MASEDYANADEAFLDFLSLRRETEREEGTDGLTDGHAFALFLMNLAMDGEIDAETAVGWAHDKRRL